MRARRSRSKAGSSRLPQRITVLLRPRERHRGIVRCGWLHLPCALGPNGVTYLKREGDGATPAGRHRLLYLYLRHDRRLRPPTQLPVRTLRRNDGWCDDKSHGRYNCLVRLPNPVSHEKMWRDDHLYDLVGVLDWNRSPRIRGRGSAIFMHLCRPGYLPTEGCIALSPRDLTLLLAAAGPRPMIAVGNLTPRKTHVNTRR